MRNTRSNHELKFDIIARQFALLLEAHQIVEEGILLVYALDDNKAAAHSPRAVLMDTAERA